MTRPRVFIIALLGAVLGLGLGIELAIYGLIDASVTDGAVRIMVALVGGILLLALVAMPRSAGSEPGRSEASKLAETGWAEFRRELRRTRRAARPMTVVRIPGASSATATDADLLAVRAEHLAGELRLVDRTWVDDGSLYVLLPEAPREAAASVIERIGSLRPDLLSGDLRMATFPDDGLTSGALISAIHGGSSSGHVPTPIRASVVDHLDDHEEMAAPSGVALP